MSFDDESIIGLKLVLNDMFGHLYPLSPSKCLFEVLYLGND